MKKSEKKFISLKLKWAIGTAIGVLLIFLVFSILLYQSFSSLLLKQEKQYAKEALTTATSKLSSNNRLDVENVQSILNADLHEPLENGTSIYKNSVITTFSRKNIGVSVYDLKGKTLFESRKSIVRFNVDRYVNTRIVQENGNHVFVASQAVYSKKKGNIIGYVQVTNNLRVYDNTLNKLLLIFIVLGISGAFASGLVGYILAAWLLRPVELLNNTIEKINGDTKQEALAKVRVPIISQNDELTELSRLFNEMLDRMQEYIEQQQQFVEDVSHELRTPVAVIQGHLDLLNRWGKDDPTVLNESIGASLQEIKRMKSLVQEMLDLSRAGQVEIQFSNEKTELNSIIVQVFNDFNMIHPKFQFTLDDELKDKTFVQMYRNHLEQVLIILMDNAVKYSTNRKEVHMALARNGRYVQVVIQDFGEGISHENLNKIFNRFYRVDKARSRDKGGNGLGLSIAKRLIDGYHGKLTVESSKGRGSIFRISLPIIK